MTAPLQENVDIDIQLSVCHGYESFSRKDRPAGGKSVRAAIRAAHRA